MSNFHHLPSRLVTLGVPAALTLLFVAGCSSGVGAPAGSDAQMDSINAGGRAAPEAGPGAARSGAADFSSGARAGSKQDSKSLAELTPRALIKTAAVSLQADNVDQVLQQVTDVALTSQGEITSENTSTNRKGQAVRSQIVLRVPVGEFESAVDEIANLGIRHSLTSSVEDVTAAVADINSRVRSAQDSIAQLRRLFTAAKKLGDIIALESELSQREADLEALQAQQRALADQTALSTITVSITRTSTPPAADNDSAGGFISGLKAGWDNLVGFVRALSHGLGLVLPLGTLVLMTAALAWLLVRRFTPWAAARGNGPNPPAEPVRQDQ